MPLCTMPGTKNHNRTVIKDHHLTNNQEVVRLGRIWKKKNALELKTLVIRDLLLEAYNHKPHHYFAIHKKIAFITVICV